nr:reverse transcriptase domain-containing protein [Tanacetum cinerariifolium]
MAAEGNGDLPVPDLLTMEELCQPSLNGRGGPIAPISIQETNFRLNNDTIQQVQNSCQFHGLPGGTFMKRRPEECYVLIENITARHNGWDTSAQQRESSINHQVKAVTPNCETFGGPHSFNDCPATVGNTQNVYVAGAYQVVTTTEFTNFMKVNDAILKNMQTNMTYLTNSNLELKNMFGKFMKMNTTSSSGSGTLLGNTITNPKEDLKGITTRSGTAYQGPTIPTTSFSSSLVVECDTVHPTNNESTEDVQPPVVPTESLILTLSQLFLLSLSPLHLQLVPQSITKDLQFLIYQDCMIRSSVTKLMTNERN